MFKARLPLSEVPAFSRVKVTDFGSVAEVSAFPSVLDDVVAVWTRSEPDEDPFAVVDLRGVVGPSSTSIVWLPTDATAEVVYSPRFAGQPEDLIEDAVRVEAPEGSRGGPVVTPDGWPALLYDADLLFSPVQGWSDPETSVETLLCALSVAPDGDPQVRPMLLAALRARYLAVQRDPRTYPPPRYPWVTSNEPNDALIEYLTG